MRERLGRMPAARRSCSYAVKRCQSFGAWSSRVNLLLLLATLLTLGLNPAPQPAAEDEGGESDNLSRQEKFSNFLIPRDKARRRARIAIASISGHACLEFGGRALLLRLLSLLLQHRLRRERWHISLAYRKRIATCGIQRNRSNANAPDGYSSYLGT